MAFAGLRVALSALLSGGLATSSGLNSPSGHAKIGRVHVNRLLHALAWSFVLMLLSPGAQSHDNKQLQYCYVSLDAVVPPGFSFFFPVAIQSNGRVYGNVCDDNDVDCIYPRIAVYANGKLTPLNASGVVNTVNAAGTIGGYVVIDPDPDNYATQAALFRNKRVELIPLVAGEMFPEVFALNDRGTALVRAYDEAFRRSWSLFRNGQVIPLDFGPALTNPSPRAIDNKGTIVGRQGLNAFDGATGFRFDLRSGEATLLKPELTEPLAWALDINKRGDVLGYSFVSGGQERIGVWRRDGEFKTYFVEGTPEFPTISNKLLFNNKNLIVITDVSNPPAEQGNSYLLPEAGKRVNLAELVANLPNGANLRSMLDLNDRGDMIGFGGLGSFLLQRIGRTGQPQSSGHCHPNR